MNCMLISFIFITNSEHLRCSTVDLNLFKHLSSHIPLPLTHPSPLSLSSLSLPTQPLLCLLSVTVFSLSICVSPPPTHTHAPHPPPSPHTHKVSRAVPSISPYTRKQRHMERNPQDPDREQVGPVVRLYPGGVCRRWRRAGT